MLEEELGRAGIVVTEQSESLAGQNVLLSRQRALEILALPIVGS